MPLRPTPLLRALPERAARLLWAVALLAIAAPTALDRRAGMRLALSVSTNSE
jgi:hypothetical protein